MRSAASLPESRRAILDARSWSGAMTRSANDSSNSLVSSGGAFVSACTSCDRAVHARRGVSACGGADGSRDQHDREEDERAAENQKQGHLTPRP